MGSLSRSFDNWARHQVLRDNVIFRSSPGMVELSRIKALKDGFEAISDELSHLAWVQQQSTHMQLTAQYRVMQLQEDANNTLAEMSSQLTQISDVLRSINDVQQEQLEITKAERTLKEVLFQLSLMLEEMILPDDAIARLALSQRALDILDEHGLGTSHLSDLDDKRAFAAFVKTTRKTVRDTSPDDQADLLAFEAYRKAYLEARELTFPAFMPLDPPAWKPTRGPQWHSEPGPEWRAGTPPQLILRTVRPMPVEAKHPGKHPTSKQFQPLPIKECGLDVPSYKYYDVRPGTFTPDNVPTQEETNSRFPRSGRSFIQWLDSSILAGEHENARRFEQALRDWATAVRAHEAYKRDIKAWHKDAADVEAANRRISEKTYPDELEAFHKSEAQRRQEYEAACARHAEDEKKRREEHDAAVAEHAAEEEHRHAEWQQTVQEHEQQETERLAKWQADLQEFVTALQDQGKELNAFLEEHPDLQLLYQKVDWEEDASDLKHNAEQAEVQLGEATRLSGEAERFVDKGKYTEAEPLAKRALAIRETVLGPEHEDTASSLNVLANAYYSQGKYTEAEPLYKRVLAIREKVLGPEHPSTALTLSYLAENYYSQCKYTEAEPLYKQALAIEEKVLGPEHPDTVVTLFDLACNYYSQCKYTEAEPLAKRALAIRETVLGPEHEDTADSLNVLANAYYSQGKYTEAEPLYKRVLAFREKVLGPEHEDTASSLNMLANAYYSQGKYTEAEPLYRRALAIFEKTTGQESTNTAQLLWNLANTYVQQRKPAEATPLYQRALAIREKVLGSEHAETVAVRNQLATI